MMKQLGLYDERQERSWKMGVKKLEISCDVVKLRTVVLLGPFGMPQIWSFQERTLWDNSTIYRLSPACQNTVFNVPLQVSAYKHKTCVFLDVEPPFSTLCLLLSLWFLVSAVVYPQISPSLTQRVIVFHWSGLSESNAMRYWKSYAPSLAKH